MAMLLYTIDYWEIHHRDDLAVLEPEEGGLKIPFAAIGRMFGASSEL